MRMAIINPAAADSYRAKLSFFFWQPRTRAGDGPQVGVPLGQAAQGAAGVSSCLAASESSD